MAIQHRLLDLDSLKSNKKSNGTWNETVNENQYKSKRNMIGIAIHE